MQKTNNNEVRYNVRQEYFLFPLNSTELNIIDIPHDVIDVQYKLIWNDKLSTISDKLITLAARRNYWYRLQIIQRNNKRGLLVPLAFN